MSRFSERLKSTTGVIATVAALLVGFGFYNLGMWQLSRADEKNAIVQSHQKAAAMPALQSLSGDASEVLYRQVQLRGQFDFAHQFLLDNRTVAGQPGFEVITPFFISSGQYVLVNRGWLGHNGDRQVRLTDDLATPKLATSGTAASGQTTLTGLVVTPSRGFVLGDSTAQADNRDWPMILQYIDYETIAAKLDKIPLLDAVIVASEGQAGNYLYNWKPVASGAQKHLGYAFQWFAMLVGLVVLYLYLMVIKKNE